MLLIYTDGARRGHKDTGYISAYAFGIFEGGDILFEYARVVPGASNNQMEMQGVIDALHYLNQNQIFEDCELYSDSQYVVKGINEWIEGWIRKGWINSFKEPVANKELWVEMHKLYRRLNVKIDWVRGHNGDPYNEYVDELCNKALDKYLKENK